MIKWDTPFDRLYKQKPDYSMLQVFGSLCYTCNVNLHKEKLEPRATIKCIYLGVATQQKGFKVLNINAGQVFVSRDMVFYENIFPYYDISQPHGSDSLFLADSVPSPVSSSPPPNFGTKIVDTSSNSNPRPTRQVQEPLWLNDYICHFSQTLMCGNTIKDQDPNEVDTEPVTFHQVRKHEVWRQAMSEELRALLKNETWIITDLPDNTKPITCKWIYKIKRKPDRLIKNYKARLVAKGYLQTYDLDYYDSFAPWLKWQL